MAPFTILVVDTRHRCLGPMIESLLGAALARHRADAEVVVVSAGTRPEPGLDHDAVLELSRRGAGVPEAAVPRGVDDASIRGSDLVLVAARHHRARVAEQAPSALRRTFCLTEFAHLAPRSGWPGPGGDLVEDLADLVRHAADDRGLVLPDDTTAVDLTDPDGGGRRRVRRAAKLLAALTEDLARLATGSEQGVRQGVRR